MAQEKHQDKNTYPATWHEIDLIIRKISTFLGPTDLSSFRLVCQKWKIESSPIWEYHRMCHTLNRPTRSVDKLMLDMEAFYATGGFDVTKVLLESESAVLTVFREYRPPRNNCEFDCVGAEELRKFFLGAKKDAHAMGKLYTNCSEVKLRQWNRFGNFLPGEQEGAKWFLNELPDKVMNLTLDRCNLSISQGEFFPTLCRMTRMTKMIIKGTYFQLRKSFPVEPTMAEISPLPRLKIVEMNYERCTAEKMPNYIFPWNLFLEVMPNKKIFFFCYSNLSDLDFAIQQFYKMMAAVKEITKPEDFLIALIFKNLAEPNKNPVIFRSTVAMMIAMAFNKLDIPACGAYFWLGQLYPTWDSRKIDAIQALEGKVTVTFEDQEGNFQDFI